MECDAVSSGLLRFIESLVSRLQQIGRAHGLVLGSQRGAQAHRDHLMGGKRPESVSGHRSVDPRGDRLHSTGLHVGEQDDELIASVTPQNIAGSELAPEHPCQGGQDAVSGFMEVLIVDLGEPVDIEKQARERLTASGGARDTVPQSD